MVKSPQARARARGGSAPALHPGVEQRSDLTGTRIRERREMLGLKQADLARSVEISPSYLNLIEHNRRRIGGRLLSRIARALSVDVTVLTEGAEAQQLDHLTEAAAAHDGAGAELDRMDEFIGRYPGWARLVSAQQRRITELERRVESLTDRLTHDPFLSAALHDVLSKVSAIQSTAAILTETEDLDRVWTERFHRNLHADSQKLAEDASALVGYLDAEGEAELGLVSPQEEMEAFLGRRDFHVAELEGAVPELIDTLIDADPAIRSEAGRALIRDALARYREEALAMPLGPFAEAAVELASDPARLAARFEVSLPAAFRRLASLPARLVGEPIGLAVCDGAGALTLRKGTELLPLPRFGAACALWPLYTALARPAAPVRAVLEYASRPDQRFLAYAIAEPRYAHGFAGPPIHEAMMVLIPPAVAVPPDAAGPPRTVGTTCRVCAARACPARREPSILSDGFDSSRRMADSSQN